MNDYALVLNAGSSSLKFCVFGRSETEAWTLEARGQIEGIGTRPRLSARNGAGARLDERSLDLAVRDARTALEYLGAWLRSRYGPARVLGVGHRVVHGGARYTGTTLVTPQVLQDLRDLTPLAPLHQPYNLAAIDAIAERMPAVPQVACFDTSFHRGQPAVAEVIPLPKDVRAGGVQRYGFHGLSYEYIASVLPRVAPRLADGRVIVAHLGSGASLCALKARRSVDCTLGFTALDGLCMGTRPGAVDPGVILYLFQNLGLSASDVEEILYRKSGLLGISGTSNDMRDLLASDAPGARLAMDYFGYRVVKEIGALPAVLGGVDGLVFTAGIGENAPEIRRRVLRGAGVARRRARSGGELSPATRHDLHAGELRIGVGHPDQRRIDDRQAHGTGAGAGRSARVAGAAMQLTRLTLLCLMLLSSAAMAAQQPPQESSADADREIVMAPIELDGDELFRVRGVSSFPAEARAAGIRRRIIAVARDPSIPIDSLRIVERPGAAVIMAADRMVMTIVEGDASLEDVTRSDLARAHLVRVQEAIAEYRAARTASALQRAALNTLIVTVILAISIALLVRVWRWLDGLLGRQMEARIHSVGIQSFELMRAERIRAAVRSALAMVRALVLLACGIVYVGYVLGEWPWTRGMSRNVIAFALSPLQVIGTSIVANIPSLVFLAVLFFVVRLSLRLIRLFFEAVERGTVTLHGFDPEWAQPTYKIVRIAVLAFGIVVAYPYIPGSGSAAFKGVSLFIGIVVSLGSSSALSNIIAGYMMTYRRAFRVGDRVKIGETIGDVIEMRLQVTHLRSLKNEEIVIPNSQILANEVLNYSSLARLHGLILHTEVGIGYETPWRQIEAMLLAASARTPGLLREPAPFVLLKKLGDFAVTYELNVYCGNVSGMMALYTALHRNVLDVFNEYGVQIMTPAYEGDPAEPKVVAPRDFYTAPAAMPEPAPRVSAATKESGVIG